LIDILKIKLNPLLLGGGIPLFGGSTRLYKLKYIKGEQFQGGLQILTYRIEY